jgi:hypothetical protein
MMAWKLSSSSDLCCFPLLLAGSLLIQCNCICNFSDFKEPFKLQNGWLLWAGIGLFFALISIALAGAAMTFLNGETTQREVYLDYFILKQLVLLLSYRAPL